MTLEHGGMEMEEMMPESRRFALLEETRHQATMVRDRIERHASSVSAFKDAGEQAHGRDAGGGRLDVGTAKR